MWKYIVTRHRWYRKIYFKCNQNFIPTFYLYSIDKPLFTPKNSAIRKWFSQVESHLCLIMNFYEQNHWDIRRLHRLRNLSLHPCTITLLFTGDSKRQFKYMYTYVYITEKRMCVCVCVSEKTAFGEIITDRYNPEKVRCVMPVRRRIFVRSVVSLWMIGANFADTKLGQKREQKMEKVFPNRFSFYFIFSVT